MELAAVVDVPVPPYFLCPISLELMGDPVTLPTGITYDRPSIDRWLSTSTSCPVTKQTVPEGADLTPNHTLRRLIQQWCAAHASMGVQRIPTPRAPLDRKQIEKIIQEAAAAAEDGEEKKRLGAVRRLSEVIAESERNRKCAADAGAAVVLASILKSCSNAATAAEALQTLHAMELSDAALRDLSTRHYDLIETLTAAMKRKGAGDQSRIHALLLLKGLFKATSPVRLAALSADLFAEVVRSLRDRLSRRATRAAMRVLAELCPWGRNRVRAAEAGAVGALVDVLVEGSPRDGSREAEMALHVMEYLCTCAEGREALTSHPAGLAAVGDLLCCTGAVGERAVRVLWWVGKYAAGGLAAREMLEVGVVEKLCIMAQADQAAGKARDKAREILGWHARVWNASPCLPQGMLAWELPRRT